MMRQISQHRTHASTTALAVVLVSFLFLLAVRAHAQEAESVPEEEVVESTMVAAEAVPSAASDRADTRATLATTRESLRAIRADYLTAAQEGGSVPTPALTREQQMQLRTHVDAAASKMRSSLDNAQRVARELNAVMQRLGTERSLYAQSGIDVLREVTDQRGVVSADIGEFSNLASLMIKTDNPKAYMEDVRAYAELIATELALMHEAIYEAAQMSRDNL